MQAVWAWHGSDDATRACACSNRTRARLQDVRPDTALALLQQYKVCANAQVLAIPMPGAESHLYVMSTIIDELAERGHEVMVTPQLAGHTIEFPQLLMALCPL